MEDTLKLFFILYYRNNSLLFKHYMDGAKLLFDWLKPDITAEPCKAKISCPLSGYEIQEIAKFTGLSQETVAYKSAEAAVECFIWDVEHYRLASH